MKLNDTRNILAKNIKPGEVVRFHYDGQDRIVFILNPNYEQLTHALSLNSLSRSALVSEILRKWNSYRDPEIFYINAIRKQTEDYPKSYKAYRTYTIPKMANIRLLKYSYTNQRF